MGLFYRLFGTNHSERNKPEKTVEPSDYKGYLIYPEPLADSGQYRIAGRITKEVDGQVRIHQFIRSDVLSIETDANELMLKKAQMFIDQMGEDMFA